MFSCAFDRIANRAAATGRAQTHKGDLRGISAGFIYNICKLLKKNKNKKNRKKKTAKKQNMFSK